MYEQFFFLTAIRGIKYTESLKTCNSGKDKMNLFENLGDFFNDIESPEKAVDYYKQQVFV